MITDPVNCTEGRNPAITSPSVDIFSHELNAYKSEILRLQEEIDRAIANFEEITNLTHFSLGVSNRANLMIIGLCSLVEVCLHQIAITEEPNNSFKIEDLKGNGLERLQKYLSRSGKINFGTIRQWGKFKQIYILRNALVHSYGGLVETSFIDRVKKAVTELGIETVLVGDRRIRLNPKILLNLHADIETIINELQRHI